MLVWTGHVLDTSTAKRHPAVHAEVAQLHSHHCHHTLDNTQTGASVSGILCIADLWQMQKILCGADLWQMQNILCIADLWQIQTILCVASLWQMQNNDSHTIAHLPDGCSKLGGVVLHQLGDECLPSRTCHTADDQGSRNVGPSWRAAAD